MNYSNPTYTMQAPGLDETVEQDQLQTFYVRALYDYDPKDKILLSFRRGDLIEVLSRLDSGWWDGLLGENVRGWFPSNYVEIISDADAEEELRLQAIYEEDPPNTEVVPPSAHNAAMSATHSASSARHSQASSSRASASAAAAVAAGASDRNRGHSYSNPLPPSNFQGSSSGAGRPRAATGLPPAGGRAGVHAHPGNGAAEVLAQPRPSESDFWVPRVTERGEFIYYNTQTGAESYDLPERPEGREIVGSEEYTTASSRGHGNGIPGPASGAYKNDSRSHSFSTASSVPSNFPPVGVFPSQDDDAVDQFSAGLEQQPQDSAYTSAGFSGSSFGLASINQTGEDGSIWKTRLTDDGQIYVVNLETGETRWPPAGLGSTETIKSGAITLANIAEAFEMTAHRDSTNNDKQTIPPAQAAKGGSNAISSGGQHSSGLSRLAGIGSNGIRGLRNVLGGSMHGPPSAANVMAPAGVVGTATNTLNPGHGQNHEATGVNGNVSTAAESATAATAPQDVDEGSMEGYLREKYERARHTASATGIRARRAALWEGAAQVKTDDGAPLSMVQDEANALALQRRMEPPVTDNMEVLRAQALETIDQLAIAVLPNEYASHQRVQTQKLPKGNPDARIQVLLSHLTNAVRDLLLASGTLEASPVELALLAELSGVSGAGSLPVTTWTRTALAGPSTATLMSPLPSRHGPNSGLSGPQAQLPDPTLSFRWSEDLPSSLSEAMGTVHNSNKGISAATISRDNRDIVTLTASQSALGTPPPELRELAKKACSTLSKVIFSARAISEEMVHTQNARSSGSSLLSATLGANGKQGAGSADMANAVDLESTQMRAEREQGLRQRVREQAIELAQTIAYLSDECEKVRLSGGSENWVRRVYPVLRSGIGTAGIGMETFSGGMAAGWRGSGFSLPSALDMAALRAEVMGNYNNPFDLTKDAQITLASGKLAMRRRPGNVLTSSTWRERIEPHVVDLRALLQAFNSSISTVEDPSEWGDEMPATGWTDAMDGGSNTIDQGDKDVNGETHDDDRTSKSRHEPSTENIFQLARESLLRLGTVQTLLEDIDFASSLDVDSCSEPLNADPDSRDLARQAREGIMRFLWQKQDLQDLSCTFMMDLQDGASAQSLVQVTGSILASVEALSGSLNELAALAESQAQGNNTLIGSRARVWGAKDTAPPPTASQVMSAAAISGGPGAIRAAEAVAIGMGIVGAGMSGHGGAASLLDENQINEGAGPDSAKDEGVGAGQGDAAAGVMYLGPGIAVPDGPPSEQGRNRADSLARGASPALSGTTAVTGRNRAGSLTSRSTLTTSSVPDRSASSASTLIQGAGTSPGGQSSAVGPSAGEDDGDAHGKGLKGKEAGASSGAAVIPPIVEEAPWFLEPDYEPGDIVMTPEGQVKGATLSALMERLTTHQGFDSAFNTTFLMTYRSFTTTKEFLERLIARYRISPPVGLTPSEHEVWVAKKQRPIQMRVFNVLKLWLEQHFYEGEDEEFLPQLKEFARTEATNAKDRETQLIHTSSTALLRVLDRRDGAGEQSVRTLVHTTSAPAPIIPKNLKKVKVTNVEPLEMARQLTLIESHRYRQIKPAECLGKAWTAPHAEVNAKGIKSMIALSNDLTGWVMESILAQTDLKQRSAHIKHFINIADRCRGLNNFSTMTAIISALNSAPIHRMKRTWDAVNQRTVAILDTLMRTMSSTKNFAYYRDHLHTLNPPCVPFLGVWLTDLTFIEDGNPDRLKTDNRLINFNKRQKTAEVIREIMIYQSTPYNLTPVPLIQQYLEAVLVPSQNQDLMFDQSEKLEPKEREDERIARLLQESGFL